MLQNKFLYSVNIVSFTVQSLVHTCTCLWFERIYTLYIYTQCGGRHINVNVDVVCVILGCDQYSNAYIDCFQTIKLSNCIMYINLICAIALKSASAILINTFYKYLFYLFLYTKFSRHNN